MMRKEFDKRRRYLVEEINKAGELLLPGSHSEHSHFPEHQKDRDEFACISANTFYEKYRVAVIAGSIFGSSGEGFCADLLMRPSDETLKTWRRGCRSRQRLLKKGDQCSYMDFKKETVGISLYMGVLCY
jgi:aspartate/methionine/tyrosine aminotransferase